jgi:hypothetical protein
MNISGLDGESMAVGALDCTRCSEETSTVQHGWKGLMEMVVEEGGIQGHPLWMDAMEEVEQMGGM